MDERLDYSSDDQLRKVSSTLSIDWIERHKGSTVSIDGESSTLFLRYGNFHLNLIQKKEYSSDRTTIPSSKFQRLSYYTNYTSSVSKILLICMSTGRFNRVLWNYIFNVFLKSLPHMYVQLFLASYVPEDHLYLPKMVPFFYGFKLAFVVTSIFEILIYLNDSIINFGYLLHGLHGKNPWNRCTGQYHFEKLNVTCLTLDEFAAKINSTSWDFIGDYYETVAGERFQLVQIEHFRYYLEVRLSGYLKIVYFLILWSVTVFGQKAVLKKWFWKLITAMQISFLIVQSIALTYLLYSYGYEKHVENSQSQSELSVISDMLSQADVDLLAESTIAPPVVHVLTARSTQLIDASQDSFFICLSNAVVYIFRFILNNRLKTHCNNLAGTQIFMTHFNGYSWFYFWPLFFSSFLLGDLFSLGFMALRLAIEILTITVTYHCYVQVIIYEWKWIKQWMVAVFTTVFCVLCQIYVPRPMHSLFSIYNKGLATFCEVFVLYYLYPVGRLVDDIRFHTGYPPTTLRIISLKFMPVFYFVKFFIILDTLIKVLVLIDPVHYLKIQWDWSLTLIPYALGMIYIAYKYILVDKVGWHRMFVPTADWGPRDHDTRQLRKEYDSRYFIRSQSLRELSRYMMEKSEAKAFQLDLNYDPFKRTIINASKFNLETEKKDL